MARSEMMETVKDFIRAPYAFPGGYPKILIMSDGECLCAGCAKSEYRLISESTRNSNRDGWQVVGVELHMEGAPLYCAHCGAGIESAYGDPETDGE